MIKTVLNRPPFIHNLDAIFYIFIRKQIVLVAMILCFGFLTTKILMVIQAVVIGLCPSVRVLTLPSLITYVTVYVTYITNKASCFTFYLDYFFQIQWATRSGS